MTNKLLFICLVFLSVNVSAQEVTTDPFAANQTDLSDTITLEWDKIWNGCNTLVKRPIAAKGDASRYLGCFFGNLPSYLRVWADTNKSALSGAKEILKQYFSQHMPPDENTVSDRQNIIRVAVHAHQRLAAWHQRMAEQSSALEAANFLVTNESGAILEEIQKSINSCSSIARDLLEELKEERTCSQEELQKKCEEYLENIFAAPVKVIEKQLITMLNAINRAERQYPGFLGRDGTDPREFIKAYDEFFTNIFDALSNCAQNIWIKP